MDFLNFTALSIHVNLAVFAAAGACVWVAGTRVAGYADTIARKTGIGHVAAGLVLLGGITSLPEIAVAVFSSLAGNTALAVNNLLGGIAMQKAILAGVDGFIGRDALTVISASPAVLLQAALSALLLILAAAAVVVGDRPVLGIGIWSWTLLLVYCFSIWTISTAQGRPSWEVRGGPRAAADDEQGKENDAGGVAQAIFKTVLAALVILFAGFVLSRTGDAIAEQSGLGQSFVGVALLSFATSLPELSTVTAALKMRRYEMAISDILGTNLFNAMLIFLVDAVYDGDPVFNEVDEFSLLAALLGVLMAAIYLIGLIERRNRTILRFGVDSVAILVVYLGGLYMLYQLR